MFNIPDYVNYTNQLRKEREELDELLENDEITEEEYTERIENQPDFDDWNGMIADHYSF